MRHQNSGKKEYRTATLTAYNTIQSHSISRNPMRHSTLETVLFLLSGHFFRLYFRKNKEFM